VIRRFLRRRAGSFRYAFAGFAYSFRTQENIWIHSAATLAVVAMGLWLGLSIHDWVLLILTISAVWVAEFFNTAIEAVVDLASPDIHPLAKTAKDVGAAAVLVTAIAAVVIGLLILGPPLWPRLSGFFH
jgi:diacylglycerol kinase